MDKFGASLYRVSDELVNKASQKRQMYGGFSMTTFHI